MIALVVAEQNGAELRPITGELVAAAHTLGARVTVAVIDSDPDLTRTAVEATGADEIIAIPVAPDSYPGEIHRDVVADLISENGYDITLVGFTSTGISYAGSVAARLGIGFASGITQIFLDNATLTARRPAFAGKVLNTVVFDGHDQVLVSARKGAFTPLSMPAKDVGYSVLRFEPSDTQVSHIGYVENEGGVDITAAEFILSIGRGAGGKENLPRFDRLAQALGATLAGSRPLIDAGVLHPSLQVGTSGRSVHPKVYLALGISGAIQHVAGITDSETIIAVNTDGSAPIFDVADYGAVADLFAIAGELEKILATEPLQTNA